jgi:spore germination cell wall hydrolase CwlJ-like protein
MEVLFKRWQYSSLTDPRDPQLTTWPKDDPVWGQCLYVADGVLNGVFSNPVPGADSYHDISIPAPAWATPEMFVKQIGKLRFYNVDKDVEEP